MNVLNISSIVISKLPLASKMTAGVLISPYVKSSYRIGKNIIRSGTIKLFKPINSAGRSVLRLPAPEQVFIPPSSTGLFSHPIAFTTFQWLKSPKVLIGIYTTVKLIQIAYGYSRGRKTTFTPSKAFVKAVRSFIDKPWDAIVILFQLGSTTVIIYGIVFVVIKTIKVLNSKTLLSAPKVESMESTSDFGLKQNNFQDKTPKKEKYKKKSKGRINITPFY